MKHEFFFIYCLRCLLKLREKDDRFGLTKRWNNEVKPSVKKILSWVLEHGLFYQALKIRLLSRLSWHFWLECLESLRHRELFNLRSKLISLQQMVKYCLLHNLKGLHIFEIISGNLKKIIFNFIESVLFKTISLNGHQPCTCTWTIFRLSCTILRY